MKTKYLDFLNEAVDYSEFISDNKFTIYDTQIDLKDLAIEKYKDLTDINIRHCSVLNQDTNFSIFQKLEKLSCHHNQLTTLPDLSNCSQLKELYCNNNQLVALSDLSNCSQLEMLYCHNNQLATLPDLANCSQLKPLSCYNNQLATLPDLSNCSKLEWLDCNNNQLTELPDLANCSQLKWLNCNNNQLTTLPNLSNCSQLERLDCDNNQLTTLPDLSNCSQLKWLDCSNNQLTSCSSFYKIGVGNVTFSNNPIPPIEIEFCKNVNGINDYYFDLFNYCVDNDILFEEFKNIYFPKDFYDNYISKVTTPTQKKYIGYLTHKKDFDNSIEDLFNYD